TQPWYFLVLEGKNKNKIAEILKETPPEKNSPQAPETGKPKEGFSPTAKATARIIEDAPCVIIIFNKCPYTRSRKNVLDNWSKHSINSWEFEIQSIAAAIQNMLLASHSTGLGGVWLCDPVFMEEPIKEYLKINLDIIGCIALGYQDHSKPSGPLNKIINYNCTEFRD
ncbi:MAG: nitroreductase family protein, partial [Candidatus ainarchaeum sp.]|nr:nitroreductase family protein [Candidatus ainarchaeum sp.]